MVLACLIDADLEEESSFHACLSSVVVFGEQGECFYRPPTITDAKGSAVLPDREQPYPVGFMQMSFHVKSCSAVESGSDRYAQKMSQV